MGTTRDIASHADQWERTDTSHDFNMAGPSEVVTDLIAEDNLVELWADYPCLFDVRSTDFKNRDKREQALEQIAAKVQMTCV